MQVKILYVTEKISSLETLCVKINQSSLKIEIWCFVEKLAPFRTCKKTCTRIAKLRARLSTGWTGFNRVIMNILYTNHYWLRVYRTIIDFPFIEPLLTSRLANHYWLRVYRTIIDFAFIAPILTSRLSNHYWLSRLSNHYWLRVYLTITGRTFSPGGGSWVDSRSLEHTSKTGPCYTHESLHLVEAQYD